MYDLKTRFKAYRGIMRELSDLETELNAKWYDATGVKGIRYDKIGGSAYQQFIELKRLDLFEEIEGLRVKIASLHGTIDELEIFLDAMEPETAKAVRQIYVYGRRYVDVARELYISKSGLEKRINKEIEKIEKGMRPPN